MKNSVKKIFKSIAISVVTLVVGFGITAISFNLFDNLSRNELRVLFAVDFIILFAIGGITLWSSERKATRLKKERELAKRHEARVIERAVSFAEINSLLDSFNNAA